MIGIPPCADTAIKNVVIACTLAFGAHPSLGEPNGRVEPIKAANELHEKLSHAITTFHVCEFMRQNGLSSFLTPRVCDGRQEDDRISKPPRHRRQVPSNSQVHSLSYAEFMA